MKKLRKMITALALSASLLLAGCSGTLNPPMPGAGGQQETQAAQGTQAAQAAQGTTRANETANVSQSNVKTPAMDLNGYTATVSNALYCATDNGDLVVMSGDYESASILLMFASTTRLQANTSFSRSDFGSTMELMAVIVEPPSGVVIADSSASGITTASFSVTDISGSSMNVSMSATVIGYDLTFNINASGTVTLSDADTCTRIVSEFDELAASTQSTVQSSADSNRQPFTCTGCKGSLKCQHCGGDGVCPACLGLLDHCISCGGSHVCQYCRGTGTCSYCNGEGVMY